jgi:thiopurine S-methyltransferase
MDREFWQQRWRNNQIGFHQTHLNPHLLRYWERLGVPPGGRVLVPLCGKSLDMCWLSERHAVLGVELSEKAIEDFGRENTLAFARTQQPPFSVYRAGAITLLCGDFFELQPGQTGALTAVYDRAALIALPEAMRRRYAVRLAALVKPGTSMLLITLDYHQSEMKGPPFCVTAAEVETLFAAEWALEDLETRDILVDEPRFRERGLSRLAEQVYLLTRR